MKRGMIIKSILWMIIFSLSLGEAFSQHKGKKTIEEHLKAGDTTTAKTLQGALEGLKRKAAAENKNNSLSWIQDFQKEIINTGKVEISKNAKELFNPNSSLIATDDSGETVKQAVASTKTFIQILIVIILLIVLGIDIIKGMWKPQYFMGIMPRYALIIILITFPVLPTQLLIFIKNTTNQITDIAFENNSIRGGSKKDHKGVDELPIAIYDYQNTLDYAQSLKQNWIEKLKSKVADEIINKINPLRGTNYSWKEITFKTLYYLNLIAGLVVVMVSNMLTTLLAVLFPITIALSVIPGFAGGIISFLRYYIVFLLWEVIANIMRSFSRASGISNKLAEAAAFNTLEMTPEQATLFIDHFNIIDDATYLSLFLSLIFTIIIPKIADILVTGGQAGGFFSVVTGIITKKTAAAGGTAMKGGKVAAGAATGGVGLVVGEKVMKAVKSVFQEFKENIGKS